MRASPRRPAVSTWFPRTGSSPARRSSSSTCRSARCASRTRSRRRCARCAAIAEVASDYDFIFLDCPPSLSLLTLNGLCAADSVLIPMQCEYYALEGLSDLVQTLKKVRAHLNPGLEIEGILRTMYDPRNTLALNVAAELERHFGDKLYRTMVPRNIRLAEAPSHGVPALRLEKNSKGAQAYLALAGEMLRRGKGPARRRLPRRQGEGRDASSPGNSQALVARPRR